MGVKKSGRFRRPASHDISPSVYVKGWFCYILRCEDGTLYTGVTTDPTRREQQHNSGIAAKYTRVRLPVKIVYCEPLNDRSGALRREHQIRQLSRTEKLTLIGAAER